MLAHISARGESAPPPPALAPDIRAHKSFHSEFLPNDRDVLVYLPPCYAREAERRYTEVNGGRHDEAAWAERVEPVLRYLFPQN